jgi:hypothetical protein
MISLSNTRSKSFVPSNSLREAALDWYEYGYNVIPVFPGTKRTAVKWNEWLAGTSPQTITSYWLQHPKYEIGFIVGNNFIVLDADNPKSVAALTKIEAEHGVKPNLIIKTNKGFHHHFKLAAGTVAKSDSHCTRQHPERIDIKTARGMVILPPSTGKSIALNEAETANDLTEVGQDFIDAINRHNGRNEPKSSGSSSQTIRKPANSANGYFGLKALLARIDPDGGYDDWFRVLMGIFYHTGGSNVGFEIADTWSSGGSKYCGKNAIRAKWNSFNPEHPRPVTIGTIISMVENGFEIFHAAENQFEIVTTVDVGGAQ